MNIDSKIFIAGHKGLVGSAILRKLKKEGYNNFVFSDRKTCDLTETLAVRNFFESNEPEYVILAAAKVGGIVANNTYRAQFIFENLQIQNNIIHQSYLSGVKKLLFLGSSCIYPKMSPQPMSEDHLLTNTLEYTNEPYAIAKIAGIKMCESYNLQYGTNFISVMPTNMYGDNDNFDLEKSHVLPALIRKMHLAKALSENNWDAIKSDLAKMPIEEFSDKSTEAEIISILNKYGITQNSVQLWGTGSPMREFLHSDDLADACVYLMQNLDFKGILEKDYDVINPTFPYTEKEVRNTHINIGSGKDISIKELATLIKDEIVGYKGNIIWDSTKPDGTPRKLMSTEKILSYGWKPSIQFAEGIAKVYKNYLK